jgi:hypothetical protein
MRLRDQWQRVQALHDGSETDERRLWRLKSLRAEWTRIKDLRREFPIATPEDWRTLATTPIEALMRIVELGWYPPPELLTLLSECWREYADGAGDVEIEEAFFGPPVPKAGNFSRRRAQSNRNARLSLPFWMALQQGKTRRRAAEIARENAQLLENGPMPSVDSILDMLRWVKKDTDPMEMLKARGKVRKARKRE